MAILCFFVFYPLLKAFVYSAQSYNLLSPPRWVGLDNYRALMADDRFGSAFLNSIRYFICVVPLLIVLPMLLAILVNRQLKGITVFRALFYIPVITSMVVAGIMWKWIYMEGGILDWLLIDVCKIVTVSPRWLTDPKTALYSVMVVTVWKGLGYYMVVYLAGLQAIPVELYEAAKIDGASAFKRFKAITGPMLAPSMAVVAVMSSMAAMKVFDEIYVMTAGGPFETTQTVVYDVYVTAFNDLKFGYASAMGVILFVVLLVFSTLSVRMSERSYSGA
jgi:putative chitobiose transport system permease protein